MSPRLLSAQNSVQAVEGVEADIDIDTGIEENPVDPTFKNSLSMIEIWVSMIAVETES